MTKTRLFDEEVARRLMPPRAKLFKDRYNKRWLVYDHLSESSRSRSWRLYGDFLAMSLVIHWELQHTVEFGGTPNPHEFITKAVNDAA